MIIELNRRQYDTLMNKTSHCVNWTETIEYIYTTYNII